MRVGQRTEVGDQIARLPDGQISSLFQISAASVCPALARKIFAFRFSENCGLTLPVPHRHKGVSRSSRTWSGMRWTRRCWRRAASTRTAKSCGPDRKRKNRISFKKKGPSGLLGPGNRPHGPVVTPLHGLILRYSVRSRMEEGRCRCPARGSVWRGGHRRDGTQPRAAESGCRDLAERVTEGYGVGRRSA